MPKQFLIINRKKLFSHLYLIDDGIAKDAVKCILPYLIYKDTHIVCETNPGLGLITTELLNGGIELVRLYESCDEFRNTLKNLVKMYPDRIELFSKDIFYMNVLSYLDKQDRESRVEEMLKGIPIKHWEEDPVLTIIGPMANRNFLRYLIRAIIYQEEIALYGRLQMFVFMSKDDYNGFTVSPVQNSRAYKFNCMLFQLLFDYTILGEYPRKSFLPWSSATEEFNDHIVYLVRIEGKRILPLKNEQLLHFYYFLKQISRKGNQRVIPTVENWLPGLGFDLITSYHKHKYYNLSIFTESKELSPHQLLFIFSKMLQHPEYSVSTFIALTESNLITEQTVETDVAEIHNKLILNTDHMT
ncbi:hypothetical protein FQA39_LY02693 [Lamprigera yunnana]|nr:hypothetical protein FQA39_LY02693 [Lamprigera yunnana]